MLTERNRAVLHQRFTAVVRDEEAVSEMLSHFPVNDLDRPATESFVEARVNALGLRLIMWMVGLQLGAAGLILGVIRTWLAV